MAQGNVGQKIKQLYLQSGILGKLIAVSTIVFLIFALANLVEYFIVGAPIVNADGKVIPSMTEMFRHNYMSAPGNPSLLLYKPWSIITQLFTHGDFSHLLFNMIALYFSGRIFINFFGERRLLLTYFLGGIFAYLFHLLACYTIPNMAIGGVASIFGASGSVMAIFIACVVHRPNYPVHLFGVIKLPLFVLGGLYLLSDLIGVGSVDTVAHFAHLGGALFGGLSVIKAFSSKNIMNRVDRFIFKSKLGKSSFKRNKSASPKAKGGKRKKSKMKVHQSTKASSQTDDEYNADKVVRKERIDAILEKISKKGYEGLNKEEKDILFNESKR
ncbi:MAG: membrane associated rhomboid family serine protease [Crocinitomix sp.]|jgi:membrane associated rhomboid family serine protease